MQQEKSSTSIKPTRLFVPTPRVDPIDLLRAQLRELRDENTELKGRLEALETRLTLLESQKQIDMKHILAQAKEVEHTLTASMANLATQVNATTTVVSSKVEECIQERHRQKGLALSLHIGGLLSTWWEDDDCTSTLANLNQAIHPAEFDPNTIEKVHHHHHNNQGTLVFKNKEARKALLQQA
ncbi:hypothetical protein GOP47_0023891 [Adiantum capillus-veneris]|uniref:Uncharacterized protein n=1 Tax=Adiantum capillus-veneris TaxID=13818 RepID=A0A9D4U4D8_ADICA|nr:hypothetical protein GOP47_0023891 [Adiantum capillus-veneris]